MPRECNVTELYNSCNTLIIVKVKDVQHAKFENMKFNISDRESGVPQGCVLSSLWSTLDQPLDMSVWK